MGKKKWAEMTTRQRVVVVVTMVVQVALALAAWGDLARRPIDEVNGSKRWWTGIIGINFIGPILYFAVGRRPASD